MSGASGIRVLVVEHDVAAIGRIFELSNALPSEHLTIAHVANVRESQRALKNERFDALILSRCDDMTLDDVRHAATATPDIPVIVLCSEEDEQFALAALHAGAQDCLFKSQLNPQLLSRSLRYAIERIHTQEQLAYLAQYDSLTGLPNRVLLRDRLVQAITHAEREGSGIAVMFLDLDYFKSVNNMLGHEAGDQLLTDVATRIMTQIRRGDTFARMGGDEFTVLLQGVRDPAAVAAVAQKILDVMSRAFVVGGEEMFITTSIGIATYPACGIEPSQLKRNADAALYYAKESGRGCYRFYDPEMNNLAAARIKTATQLRHAVTRSEFELYYQPLVNVAGGDVLGFEALLRWKHRERGLVNPAEFIPLLEHTGLIVPVGEWAVRAACAQQKAWADAGYGNLGMAVNVSARQFRQKNFVSMISEAVRESGMDPRYLQLEITESMLVDNVSAAAATLRALHTVGVRFSIDDFGTGYSSLNYLKQFPLHTLKIDRSFMENIARDDSDAAIVSAIISLGHSLHMKVVAEGVETEQQLALLQNKGCDAVQGFYFARPMSAGTCEQWLREHQIRHAAGHGVARVS